MEEKKLPFLADIRDESTEEVRVVLEPKSRTHDPTDGRVVVDEILGGRPGLYSVKQLVGHCQGAAAAVEIAAAAMAYEHGVIPAPPTVAPGHHRLLDGPTPIDGGLTLKTSLGMGGQNSAVVLAPA